MTSAAYAHVGLDSPNGGEAIAGGFTFPIDWSIPAGHDTLDWDLWYSTTSNSGPWIVIASNLPKGNIATGATHSFDWQVPNSDLSAVWIRVQQDNTGEDYDAISSASFAINAAEPGDFTGNGFANGDDLLIWENAFGTSAGAFFSDGDNDSDGDVDGFDFLGWQRNYSNGGGLAGAFSVPEPSSLLLFALAGAIAMLRRGNFP